jgi:GNAT superfamily N-acetyltransferase
LDGPRAPRRGELDALLDLVCEVWPHFHDCYTAEELHAAIRRPVHRREARVIVEGDRVVSNIQVLYNHVSVYGSRFGVAGIGCVCTREDRRRRGLAGAVLEHCLAEMTARRARLLYVSGDRSLYRRNHCVSAGSYLEAELDRESLGPANPSLAVRRISEDEWAAVAPLHQAEPVRFIRRADFLSETVFWWDDMDPDMWVIEWQQRPVASVVLVRHWGSEPGGTVREVQEYAGSRGAMLDALPDICDAMGVSRVQFSFPTSDRELAHMLGALGATLTPATLPSHTMRLLNLPGLMRDLRQYLAALLPRSDLRRLSFDQQDATCRFAYRDQAVELDLGQSALVVLGGPDAPAVPGDLGRVLAHVFPLPVPAPGLNHL